MAWLEEIQKPSLHLGFYCRIAGLPYIFSNFTEPSWSLGDYAWEPSLLLTDLGELGESLEPWLGIGESSGIALEFHETTTTLAIARPSLAGGYGVLDAPLDSSETTEAVFDNTESFPASGVVHIGTEAISYTSKSTTQLLSLTRGLYGSHAQYHAAGAQMLSEFGRGGARCSTAPLRMRGRTVELYICPGQWRGDGTFSPKGTGLFSSTDKKVSFELIATSRDIAGKRVKINCGELSRKLQESCCTRLPSADLGLGDARYVYIGDDNRRIQYSVYYQGSGIPILSGSPVAYSDHNILDLDGNAPPEGWYTWDQIAQYLSHSMLLGVSLLQSEEEANKIQVAVTTDRDLIRLSLIIGRDCFWKEMGYTERVSVDFTNISGTDFWEALFPVAQKEVPVFRLPAGSTRRIPYRNLGGLGFQTPSDHGWEYADGSACGSYVMIDKEVLSFTNNTSMGGGIGYLTIDRRAVFGNPSEEIYIEWSEDAEELRQVFAFERIDWTRALLFSMLESYGGWYGASAALPPSVIDVDSFDALSQEATGRDRTRDILVSEPRSIADIFAGMLSLDSLFLTVVDSEIVLRELSIVPESSSEDLGFITESMYRPTGTTYDGREDQVINVITAKMRGGEITWRQATSIGTWGEGTPLALDLESLASSERGRFLNLAQGLGSLYGEPWGYLEIEVVDRYVAWATHVGDQRLIEVDGSEMIGVCFRRAPVYAREGGDVFAGILGFVLWAQDQRLSTYSPCMYGTSDGAEVEAEHDYFSAYRDSDYFSPGDWVRVYVVGDEASAIGNRIAGIGVGVSADTIYFDDPIPTGVVVIESAGYDDVREEQRSKVYLSEGRSLGSDDDQGFVYG